MGAADWKRAIETVFSLHKIFEEKQRKVGLCDEASMG